MKFISIALAAALALCLPVAANAATKASAAADAKGHATGMTELPPLLQQAGVPCTLTDANFAGVSKAKDAKAPDNKVYEAVCQEGLGYMVLSPTGGTPVAYDCLALTVNAPKPGEPDKGGLYCRLPANANPVAGLKTFTTKAGLTCTPVQGRWMGVSTEDKFNEYEVACSEGAVYVLQVPELGSAHTLTSVDCITLPGDSCQYFTAAKRLATISGYSAGANRPQCQPSDARFVGVLPNGDKFYELACADGKSGYIFEVSPAGQFKTATECARASAIGGGCTLTATAGDTGEAGTYTRLAGEIGYPCKVSSYKSMGLEQKSNRELVELACSDHPDGAFAMLPTDKTQKGEVFNCIRAEARQLKCTLSPVEATYAKLTSELVSKGKTGCTVTNARTIGVAANGEDYVEVACQGGGGWVINYTPGIEVVKDTIACAQAKGIGGGCKLQ